jgi:hypothetical protein
MVCGPPLSVAAIISLESREHEKQEENIKST